MIGFAQLPPRFKARAVARAMRSHQITRSQITKSFCGAELGLDIDGHVFQLIQNPLHFRPHDAEPCRVATVGELATHDGQRIGVAFYVAADVHEIKQRGTLMLGDGSEDGRVIALLWQQVEIVKLLGLAQLFIKPDKLCAAVGREALYQRINARVDEQLAAGLVGEVEGLLARGYSPMLPAMEGLGYKEIIGYLQGTASLEDATRRLKQNTRRYARSKFRPAFCINGQVKPMPGCTMKLVWLSLAPMPMMSTLTLRRRPPATIWKYAFESWP